MNKREINREAWLKQALAAQNNGAACAYSTQALPGDASFRRYFRIRTDERHYLLMDAPPELESITSFIAIAQHYQNNHIRTPFIFAENKQQGFLLLEDFGETLLSEVLCQDNVDQWYRACYAELPKIQACTQVNQKLLPHFVNELLTPELEQFKQWVILKFAALTLSLDEEKAWENACTQMYAVCAEQPEVGVHRDYHSRNLMILPDNSIGILDFQDAVIGPLTYDLVSLLRDCYVDWPQDQVQMWLNDYYYAFCDTTAYSRQAFQRWFDWQGLQRHLKALFIFCRKYLRDGSTNYLAAIPRTIHYALAESLAYPELFWLHQFLKTRLQPALQHRILSILA